MATTLLKYGMTALPQIAELKTALNNAGKTRLPRLSIDENYDVATLARVMEFQARHRLRTDGIVGPITEAKLETEVSKYENETPPLPESNIIIVDLINRHLLAYTDGNLILNIKPVLGGSSKFPSTSGVFQMTLRRLRYHTSSKYPTPRGNMNFSLFYNGGEAIHQGSPKVYSHGCIHVGEPFAQQLFEWAGTRDIKVIVFKSHK